MADQLSISSLENGVYELQNALSGSEWDDDVKNSYYRFVEEERNLVSNLKWSIDKANGIYRYVTSVDIGKFQSAYSECASKLERLMRGG